MKDISYRYDDSIFRDHDASRDINLALVSFYRYNMYQKESVVPNKNGKVQFQPWPRSHNSIQ